MMIAMSQHVCEENGARNDVVDVVDDDVEGVNERFVPGEEEEKEKKKKKVNETEVDSEGFEIIDDDDDDSPSKKKVKEKKQKTKKNDDEKRKKKDEQELKKLERKKEQEQKKEIKEKENEEKRKKKEIKDEEKRKKKEAADKIAEEKRLALERVEKLKQKQSEKLLGFFKAKQPKKQKIAMEVNMEVRKQAKSAMDKLDEEMKIGSIDVVKHFSEVTLPGFKKAKRMEKGGYTAKNNKSRNVIFWKSNGLEVVKMKFHHWNARYEFGKSKKLREYDPFRAKSSSPEEDDDDDVQIIDTPTMTNMNDNNYDDDNMQIVGAYTPEKRYKRFYSFMTTYHGNYHERPPWYGFSLPPNRPKLSRKEIKKKLSRNFLKKVNDVDYDIDSGGDDYENEEEPEEGEDIMDADDYSEDDDEEKEEEEEEDVAGGQEFFIPDNKIIRGNFGEDDDVEEKEIDFQHIESSNKIEQWVKDATKQTKTLVVTSLNANIEDGITKDTDGTVLKVFEVISRTTKETFTCGFDYEIAQQKAKDEFERKKLELKEQKKNSKLEEMKGPKGESDEFGKTIFVTQSGIDKLFNVNSNNNKRLDDYVQEPKVMSVSLVLPELPEATDSYRWEMFRNKMLETNASAETNPLGVFSLWFKSDEVSAAVVRKMPKEIVLLIAKLASQEGRPQIARVELLDALKNIIAILRRDGYHLSPNKLTVATRAADGAAETLLLLSPLKKAAPLRVIFEEVVTLNTIKKIVESILSSQTTLSNTLKEKTIGLIHECVVNGAEDDHARSLLRNDIIRNVAHEKQFLEVLVSYINEDSSSENLLCAVEIANAVTKGSLCETFCVLRASEANKLATSLCDFVLATFDDRGGKNLDIGSENSKDYTRAFCVVPKVLSTLSNMANSCAFALNVSKISTILERVVKFVARQQVLLQTDENAFAETQAVRSEVLNLIQNSLGFSTDKKAIDTIFKTVSDLGDLILTLNLLISENTNETILKEVTAFVAQRIEEIRATAL